MRLQLDRADSLPLYRQLVQQVSQQIEAGALSPGTRLPTVRQLAHEHGLTRLTVQSAFAELQALGLVHATVGRGTFVSERLTPPARVPIPGTLAELLDSRDVRFSLAQSAPGTECYPAREWQACLRSATRQDCLGYGALQGEEPLRRQIAALLQHRGLTAAPELILITHGAQQGIDLAVRALSRPDQPVMLEVPCYPGALELLRARSQPCLEVPWQDDGPALEVLEEHCRRFRPPLFYSVPTFHNPTGRVSSAQNRQSLLELARRYDFYVLEDDVWGFLSYQGQVPPLKERDRQQRTIYVSSFSKTLMPALRLGFVLADPPQLAVMTALKHATDLVCSSLLQHALAEFLRRGCFLPHLKAMLPLYRQRRDALHSALSGCDCQLPAGGLSMWLRLPADCEESEISRQAREKGLVVARGRSFAAPGHLRLSFGAHRPDELRQAGQLLVRLLQPTRPLRERVPLV